MSHNKNRAHYINIYVFNIIQVLLNFILFVLRNCKKRYNEPFHRTSETIVLTLNCQPGQLLNGKRAVRTSKRRGSYLAGRLTWRDSETIYYGSFTRRVPAKNQCQLSFVARRITIVIIVDTRYFFVLASKNTPNRLLRCVSYTEATGRRNVILLLLLLLLRHITCIDAAGR